MPSLYPLFSATRCEACVILIPDIAAPAPESWCVPSEQPWVAELSKQAAPNARFFSFRSGEDGSRAFHWQEIRKCSEGLLDELLKLRRDRMYAEVPILIICFGLGGLLVKEALQSAHRQRSHFGRLLFVLAGVAFFVTPHSTSDDESSWKNLSYIPRIRSKSAKKRRMERDEIAAMARTCRQFENMSFDRPILSVFEEKETTVHSSLPGSLGNQKIKIVGEGGCRVGALNEEFLSVQANYPGSSTFSIHSDTFKGLRKFVQSSFAGAQMRIMVEMSREPPEMPSDSYTVRTHSVLGDAPNSAQKDTGAGTTGSTTASYEIIPASAAGEFETGRKAATLPCYLYGNRVRNPSFFGRSEVLRQLEERLLPAAHVQRPAIGDDLRTYAICGLGGVGKSEIATEFMFKHIKDFDAVFWLQADQTTTLRDGFSHIAVKLGLEDIEAKDQDVSTNLVKAWLAQPTKKDSSLDGSEFAKWLMIFDNVDDMDDLMDFWPQFGKGSILITSRDPMSKTNIYSGSAGIDLPPLSDNEAATLLETLTSNKHTDHTSPSKQALALAQRLAGLPLGIVQMAGFINRNDYTYDEFLKRYDEQSMSDLHAQAAGWQHTGYAHTISTVWALDKLTENSVALLEVMSLLNPDGIQEELLTEGNGKVTLEQFPSTDEAYQEARANLTRRSLVTRNKQQLELRVHRLTQDAVRAKMTLDRQQQVFATTIELISTLWPFPTMSQRHTIARWDSCKRLLPHVVRMHELHASFSSKSPAFAGSEGLARLLTDAAGYILERGGGPEFFHLLDSAESLCKSLNQDVRDLLSEIHYIRGAQATEMNNKAVALPNNVAYLNLRLELAKTTKEGTQDPKLAHAYNQAGNAFLDRNDVGEAIRLYEKSISTHRSIPENTELDRSIAVANLGSAYWIAGEFEKAASVLTQNLEAREAAYGPDDTESFRTGRLLYGLANVRASQGQWIAAYKLHTRALAQYRATLGDDHHRTADLCYKVAEHYVRVGEVASARSLLEQAHKVYSVKSYFKQELSRTNFLMSYVLSTLGEAELSERYKREALQTYRAVVRSDARPDDQITRDDFDAIVTYASR